MHPAGSEEGAQKTVMDGNVPSCDPERKKLEKEFEKTSMWARVRT